MGRASKRANLHEELDTLKALNNELHQQRMKVEGKFRWAMGALTLVNRERQYLREVETALCQEFNDDETQMPAKVREAIIALWDFRKQTTDTL